MNTSIPHMRVVVGASLLAVLGYLGFSVWVFGWTRDAALIGDVVGTWKSFAVLAFGFWLGSSSGGKATATLPPPQSAVAGAQQVADAGAEKAEQIAAQAKD